MQMHQSMVYLTEFLWFYDIELLNFGILRILSKFYQQDLLSALFRHKTNLDLVCHMEIRAIKDKDAPKNFQAI